MVFEVHCGSLGGPYKNHPIKRCPCPPDYEFEIESDYYCANDGNSYMTEDHFLCTQTCNKPG